MIKPPRFDDKLGALVFLCIAIPVYAYYGISVQRKGIFNALSRHNAFKRQAYWRWVDQKINRFCRSDTLDRLVLDLDRLSQLSRQ